ncbi:MAG TPA: molybdopterin-guanine dinucleotide biosynthesis protein B [Desulfosarcina sp.]|nr:molybdopterin-guanine dinucleotide biosynthesis protein B [Desulfosarcina sp.]
MRPAIITIVGFSDAGKTTVIEKLLPELKRRGLKVGTIKHAHHGFAIDREGKDSWRHQQAGADIAAVAGPEKTAMIINTPLERLENIRSLMNGMDLILAEGFKSARMPKVEVLRSAVHTRPLFLKDPDLFALVTDLDPPFEAEDLVVFGLDDIAALADLIVARFVAPSSAPAGS